MRTIKADLHNHLRTSSNISELFNPTVDLIQKRLGVGGIIGLINFADHRYEDFTQEKGYKRNNFRNAIYVPEKDVLVVKGQEVPTAEGHLLVLGLEEEKHLKAGRPVLDSIKEAEEEYGGIVIADHPFGRDGLGPFFVNEHKKSSSQFYRLKGWEIYNGEAALWSGANNKAKSAYELYNLGSYAIGELISSDGHSLAEIGRSYTSLKMPSNYSGLNKPEKVVEVLWNGLLTNWAEDLSGRKKGCRFRALCHIVALSPHIAMGVAKKGLSKLGIKL